MKTKHYFQTLSVLMLLNQFTSAVEPQDLRRLAREAVGQNQIVAKHAIFNLRAEGPRGLQALFDEHTTLTSNLRKATPENRLLWQRWTTAMDTVGKQRDCYSSKLYWFTDAEKAIAESRNSGKPVLSLRLLGNLDEEFSCANSRFFRTTLYANAEVADYLRQNFVLHWKSVRPVPRLTIDFGDGRKLERTLTGNSIHYILDANGKPIDALPGLYGPKAFLDGIARARDVAKRCETLTGEPRENALRSYHRERLSAIDSEWQSDLAKVNGENGQRTERNASSTAPNAIAADRRAPSKSFIERPLVQTVVSFPRNFTPRAELEGKTANDLWSKIALLHADGARLDESSKQLIKNKNATALDASRITTSKMITELPVLRILRNLERSIAEDTVRNEYQLHSRLHEWFVAQNATGDVDHLNRKVYAELFLTPDSDPWLGLAPVGSFSALENDGLVQSK